MDIKTESNTKHLIAIIDNDSIAAIDMSLKEYKVPSVTIRNLSAETHRALKLRAASAGRSTEAEIRWILNQAVQPQQQVKLGSLLADLGEQSGGVSLEIDRDQTVITQPVSFK